MQRAAQRASFLDSDAVAFDKLDVPSYWQFRGYGHPFYVNIRYRFPYKPPVIPTTGKAGRTNKKRLLHKEKIQVQQPLYG